MYVVTYPYLEVYQASKNGYLQTPNKLDRKETLL